MGVHILHRLQTSSPITSRAHLVWSAVTGAVGYDLINSPGNYQNEISIIQDSPRIQLSACPD